MIFSKRTNVVKVDLDVKLTLNDSTGELYVHTDTLESLLKQVQGTNVSADDALRKLLKLVYEEAWNTLGV